MADWRKVMFCDESTFRLVLRGYKLVRRPSGVSRYDSRCIIKTVKHPKKGAFSWDKGRGGLNFLPNNVTMREDSYSSVLDHHMLPFEIFVDATTSCRMVILPTGPGLLKNG